MFVRIFKIMAGPSRLGKARAKARAAAAPRAPSTLVVTEAGARSKLWRRVGGVYQRLFVLSLAGVVAGLAIAGSPAHASQTPRPGIKDGRVRNVNYDPDQVVTLSGHFRHAIEIQFGANETVTQAALGDTISWAIAPVANIIFLKPRERARGTNLIVITSTPGGARTYHFQLTMGTGPLMYGVRFRYSEQDSARAALLAHISEAQRAQELEGNVVKQALDHAVIEGTRNSKYSVQGASELQPSEISDNGEFTVLRYPGHADIPSIFAVNADGGEEIVPYDVRDDFVVIHAVYRQLRLRRGQQVLCVYDDGAPRNDRATRTGTVSNIIERQVKGQ